MMTHKPGEYSPLIDISPEARDDMLRAGTPVLLKTSHEGIIHAVLLARYPACRMFSRTKGEFFAPPGWQARVTEPGHRLNGWVVSISDCENIIEAERPLHHWEG